VEAPRTGVLDLAALAARSDELSAVFGSAVPFPSAVVDDCLRIGPDECAPFPDETWSGWRTLGDSYQHEKRQCSTRALIPEPWGQLLDELNSTEFLAFLEDVTGIRKLIPDPYLEGGGLHLSMPGGILAPHTDFHVYSRLDLYRRLNVLLYVNPEWKPTDGGVLTLSHATRRDLGTREIEPMWGRMVIFETNDVSVHGFTDPVATGCRRQSLAIYYYTALETRHFSGDATTHWREHGTMSGWQRPRFALSRFLMQVSRAFSLLAHLTNPNQGRRWWRWRSGRDGTPAA
jgi:hypothetical protein